MSFRVVENKGFKKLKGNQNQESIYALISSEASLPLPLHPKQKNALADKRQGPSRFQLSPCLYYGGGGRFETPTPTIIQFIAFLYI